MANSLTELKIAPPPQMRSEPIPTNLLKLPPLTQQTDRVRLRFVLSVVQDMTMTKLAGVIGAPPSRPADKMGALMRRPTENKNPLWGTLHTLLTQRLIQLRFTAVFTA